MFVLGMCTIQCFGEWFSIGFMFDDIWDDNYDNSTITNKFEGGLEPPIRLAPYITIFIFRIYAVRCHCQILCFFRDFPSHVGWIWLVDSCYSFAVWIP